METENMHGLRVFVAVAALFLAGFAQASPGAAHNHGDEAAVSREQAAALYHDYCSVCHGDKGDGNSRASGGLIPPPKDFTSPKTAIELSRERMIVSVSQGRPGTAMSAWDKRLSGQEIEAIVDYIRNSFMPAVTTETHSQGRRIFAEFCSVCHGDKGDGNSRASGGLEPPPANFTDPVTKAKLSRERMIFSVTYGRPQTAMSAWGKRLSEEEVAAVVDYVRASIMQLSDAPEPAPVDHHAGGGHDHDAHGVDNIMDPLPYGLEGVYEMGRDLYSRNCQVCHGELGDGQGPRAYFIFPKPRDFNHPAARAKYSRAHLFEVISKGALRTEMPAWEKVLTRQEIAHLAEYVFRSFIRPQASAGSTESQTDHSTMDHGAMDHSTMDHSTMDHSTMDHSTMDHGAAGHDMAPAAGHDEHQGHQH